MGEAETACLSCRVLKVALIFLSIPAGGGMSFGGPNSHKIVRVPPINGSFPLDRQGECRQIVGEYLACLKRSGSMPCRDLAQAYLSCRMARGLMEPEEWEKLGFSGGGGK